MKDKVTQISGQIMEERLGMDWSLSPYHQAVLMARDRQTRFAKKFPFNAFIVRRNIEDKEEQEDNEFAQFLALLKANVKVINPNTHIQLAICNEIYHSYIDKFSYHWTAVDLMVGEDGVVNSFVLDAANNECRQDIIRQLQNTFPKGKHYDYQGENVIDELGKTKWRNIQNNGNNCHVFTAEHLRQLAKIPPQRLFGEELPVIANEYGKIVASNFKGGQLLTRILQSMQSISLFKKLPEEVQSTVVNEHKKRTLAQSINRHLVGQAINHRIDKKARQAKKLKIKEKYFESLSMLMKERILLHRQGFTFLTNPQLFRLNEKLALVDENELKDFLNTFVNELELKAPKQRKAISFFKALHIDKVREYNQEIKDLANSGKPPEKIKNEVLLATASLFQYLEDGKSVRTIKILEEIVEKNCLEAKETFLGC